MAFDLKSLIDEEDNEKYYKGKRANFVCRISDALFDIRFVLD